MPVRWSNCWAVRVDGTDPTTAVGNASGSGEGGRRCDSYLYVNTGGRVSDAAREIVCQRRGESVIDDAIIARYTGGRG